MNRKNGILLLILASILWSFAGVCIKTMSWNGFAITGMRGLIAAIVLLPVIRRPRLPRGRYQILAVLSYVGLICLLVIATKRTTAANAILLQFTSPIYSAALGYMVLGERVTRRDVCSIALMLLGLVIFLYDGLTGGHLLGNVIALLSGVCYGAMNVFMRADAKADPAQNVFWGNLLAFFLMLPFFGTLDWSPRNTALILFMGIFQLGLAYALYAKAILHVGALDATITTVLEPLLNPLWVLIFAGETMSGMTILGGMIVIGAVLMRHIGSKRAQMSKSEIKP